MNIMEDIHKLIAEKRELGRIPTAIILNVQSYALLKKEWRNIFKTDCNEIFEYGGLPVFYDNSAPYYPSFPTILITVTP